ncbi:MAG: hypothetical protein BWY17_00661 [Deltaproteobacteria bacterium ADurb.Bin207]|nr:MAG: hypothetical protein BWY17_00661 [Deltaproteobacteria bacterium ADurb.Bin207]
MTAMARIDRPTQSPLIEPHTIWPPLMLSPVRPWTTPQFDNHAVSDVVVGCVSGVDEHQSRAVFPAKSGFHSVTGAAGRADFALLHLDTRTLQA